MGKCYTVCSNSDIFMEEYVILLGISGKRESGKSLLASYLEHYNGWTRFSLADELKKQVMKDWSLLTSQLWGKEKESPTQYVRTNGAPLTGRDIMIREGVYRRSIDPLYYCKKFDERIGDKIVCDDIRFLNEIMFFKNNHGARFVRLERSQEAIGKAALDDLSETELDKYGMWDFKLEADLNKIPSDLQTFA